MLDKFSFKPIATKVEVQGSKKVDKVRVEIVADNVETEKQVHITDIMLQGGTVATSHVDNVAEIRWTFDNA